MLWKLRLFWERLEPAAVVFFVVATLVLGSLAAAMLGVIADREARERERAALRSRSLDCLARNIYFEARGEPLAGQYAVAEVTMNRRGWGPFRKTVCEIVYQPGAFSWTSMRRLPEPSGPAWERARRVAEAVYSHRHTPTLRGARYYHAVYVRPEWAKEKQRVARIGRHIFYR
ncbi:MAG TPA: cell wall hydrolase [Burkholderiales bacterium]